jgi:outer membrane protein TolC
VTSSEREVALDEGSVQRSIVALEFVINAKVGGSLVAPTAMLDAAHVKRVDADRLVALAQGRRLNVLASSKRLEAAKDFAEEPGLRFVPVLSAVAQLRGTTELGINGHWYDESLSLNLTWTLWDAGVRSADAKARDAQEKIAELDLLTQHRIVEADVHNALAELASTQTAFDVADDVVAAAKKSVDETNDLYKQGIARAIELVDANEQVFLAEVAFAEAQYAMIQSYLDLRNALGLDPVGGEIPP